MDEKAAQDLLHERSFIGRSMHSTLLANERDPEIRFDTKKQIAAFTSQICEVIVGKTEAVKLAVACLLALLTFAFTVYAAAVWALRFLRPVDQHLNIPLAPVADERDQISHRPSHSVMEPTTGFEPVTSSLPRKCSAA